MAHHGIVLVGFRAAGKTTIGRAVARLLNLPFTDVDVEIERRAGKSVAQIFAEEGESYFRDLESSALHDLANAPVIGRGRVVATGGGVVLRAENHEYLAALGLIIHLSASVDVLSDRLRRDGARPRLTSLPLEQEIQSLLVDRVPRYQQIANATVDVGRASPLENAEKVCRIAVENGFIGGS